MRLVFEQEIESLSAKTANGVSAQTVSVRSALVLEVFARVTAASGSSPTLDLDLEVSPDGGLNWYVAKEFTQITGTGKYVLAAVRGEEVLGKIARVVWTVGGGTPSFTFELKVVGSE